MAQVKITELTAQTDPSSSDVLPLVSVSDNETKKVTVADLLENAGDGTVSAPAFSFDSQKNLGIYRPGADQLAVSVGGSQALLVESSGVTVPGNLTIEGTTTTIETTNLVVEDKNIQLATVSTPSNTTADGGGITLKGATDKTITWVNSTGCWTFNQPTNFNDHVRIDSSGNVGIGTSSPSRPLHLQASDCRIRLTDSDAPSVSVELQNISGNGVLTTNGSSSLKFSPNNSEAMRITSAGQMVIGGTSALDSDKQLTLTTTSTSGGLGILSPNNGRGDIFFGDAADDNVGQIKYSHVDDSLTIRTNAADRFTIDSSGRVGIGTTSAAKPLQIHNTSQSAILITNTNPAVILSTIEADNNDANRSIFGQATSADAYITNAAVGDTVIRSTNSSNLLFGIGTSEKLRIDSSGHILIKDATAGTYTDFQNNTRGEASSTAPKKIVFPNQYSTSNDDERLKIYLFNSGLTRQGFGTGSSYDLTYHSSGGSNQANHSFFIDGSEKLRIDPYGKLLVGTTTGDGQIEVRNTNGIISRAPSTQATDSNKAYRARNNSDTDTFSVSYKGQGYFAGNLGVGTTSPSVLLDLESNSPTIRFTDSDASGTPECQISGAGGDLVLEADRDNEKSDSLIRFLVDGSDAMRITSAGNIGVGESNPDQRLHVKTSSDDVIKLESTSGGNGPNLTFAHTGASPADNDVTAKFTFNATNDASQETTFADIKVITTDVSDGSEDAAFAFSTRNNGTFAERLRITSAGLVGINETSPAGSLHVDAASGVDGPVFDSGGSGNANHAFLVRDSANSQLLRVNNNGNVGIGTSSPDRLVHIFKGEAGTALSDSNTALMIENSAHAIIQMASPNNFSNRILFGDPQDADAGRLTYDHSTNAFLIHVNGAEQMRIDSSGRVGIGDSSPANTLSVLGASTAGSSSTGNVAEFAGPSNTNGFQVFVNDTNNNSGVQTKNGDALIINPHGGNVGIGTSSPSAKFHIADAAAPEFRIVDTTNNCTGFMRPVDSSVRFGTGSNHPLEFHVNSAEKMRIDSSGNIKQSVASGANNGFTVNNGTNDLFAFGTGGFAVNGGTATDGGIRAYNNLVFGSGSSSLEHMRLDSSGRLLIGTSGARSNLFNGSVTAINQVEVTATSTVEYLGVRNTNNTNSCDIVLAKSRGTTAGSNTIVQNDDGLGSVAFMGSDGTEFVLGGRITCEVDGTPGANDMPGRIVLATTADGASSPTERMRIASDGKIFIGSTGDPSAASTDDPKTRLMPGEVSVVNHQSSSFHLNRTGNNGAVAKFFRDGTQVGRITVDASSTSYVTSSDYRLKENVVELADGITRVKQLAPKRFNFIVDADTTVDGFLAHEAQAVVPEAVTGERDGEEMQGIDQSKLVPLLTAALQEAIAKIETLEQRLTDAGL